MLELVLELEQPFESPPTSGTPSSRGVELFNLSTSCAALSTMALATGSKETQAKSPLNIRVARAKEGASIDSSLARGDEKHGRAEVAKAEN